MRRDVAVLFVSRAIASVAQALAVLLLARWSAPHLYGTVSSVLGIGVLITAVLDFGLGDYLLRIRAAKDLQPLLAPAYFLNYVGSWGVFVLLAIIGVVLLPAWPVAAVLLAAWVAGDKYVDTGLALPIADGRVFAVGAVMVVRRCLAIAAFFAFVAVGMAALPAFALAQIVGLVAGLLYVQVKVAPRRTREGASRIPHLYSEGTWFWAATLTAQVQSLDAPIVAGISGAAMAGIYSVGGRLTRPFVLFSTALSLVLVPASTRAKPAFTRYVTSRVVTIAVALALFGLAITPFMPEIIHFTVGDAYAAGAASASVLVVAMPFVALSSALGGVLQGRGQSRFVALNGIGFGLLVVAGLAIGAVTGGAFGAALGLGIASLLKFITLSVRAWSVG